MKFLIPFFFLFISLSVFSQNENKIIWTEGERLTWSDFNGKHRTGVSYVASTTSGIAFSYSVSENKGKRDLDVKVTSNFYPESSWINPENATPYILAHEQAHFDISELHARILRKEIAATTFGKNLKKELSNLYKSVEERRVAMQHQFDLESDHSKIPDEELRWEVFIKEQLEKYDRWK